MLTKLLVVIGYLNSMGGMACQCHKYWQLFFYSILLTVLASILYSLINATSNFDKFLIYSALLLEKTNDFCSLPDDKGINSISLSSIEVIRPKPAADVLLNILLITWPIHSPNMILKCTFIPALERYHTKHVVSSIHFQNRT